MQGAEAFRRGALFLSKGHDSSPLARTARAVSSVIPLQPARLLADLFLAGNDAGAKERVTAFLNEFGWKRVIDLGGLTAARGMEAYVLFWLQVFMAKSTPDFNIRIVER
jgi:predicted dinucleotide-binding enzyme